MKKATLTMIIITAIFAFTALGIFLGRITMDGSIMIHTGGSFRAEKMDADETIPSMLVNINEADAEQLQELPGVGESIANEIIAYREENGLFRTKRDLLKVKGIGENTYEELKDMITTEKES